MLFSFMDLATIEQCGHTMAGLPYLRTTSKSLLADLRGCGESDKPEVPSGYSIDLHLADIKAVLSDVRCG